MSKIWIIEPHDPLIVRDGRPFGPTPGARAATMPFPLPSTMAGGVRTQSGLDDQGRFVIKVKDALKIPVAGPLLVELSEDALHWFAPAPADALILEAEGERDKGERKWLRPLADISGTTNLPEGLALVGMQRYDPRKPLKTPPRFWRWQAFEKWLLSPADGPLVLDELGIHGPSEEARIHVKIDTQTGTAEEGKLFQTRGLVFEDWEQRLALAIRSEETPNFALGPLGGERRLSAWRTSVQDFPKLPAELKETIARDKRCRVVLLTPAIFEQGYLPKYLLDTAHSVQPHLEAAVVPRYQVVSGWDLAIKRPKPTRRLAPAGSVYYLRLEGETDAIKQWVKDVWMQPISDNEQDNLDGFGLAVVGAWPESTEHKEASS